MRMIVCLGLVTWLAVGSAAGPRAQERHPEAPTAPAGGSDELFPEIVVPMHDGRLGIRELGRTLLDAYGFDGDALKIPDRSIDLRGTRGWLLLRASRKLLLDTARFRRSPGGDTLTITVDRARTREVRRQLRARLARLLGKLTGEDLLARRYELALPEGELDRDRPLVVLVHGVESSPAVWNDLRAFLAHEPGRFQVATFAYPDDESIDRVAAQLGQRLGQLGDQPVALVGHSMGGLVARTIVEDPELDPGNVTTLILIGTPNHGSDLAGLRFALDVAHLLRRPDGVDAFSRALIEGMQDNLIDGLGEAGGDLLPGSVFLTELARRERNPAVTYHSVLGTRAILTQAQLTAVGARVLAGLGKLPGTRLVGPKVASWLDALDELVDGRGDGAVGLESGRLEGVEPVLIHTDHVGLIRTHGLLGRSWPADEHPVFARIAVWLDEAAAKD